MLSYKFTGMSNIPCKLALGFWYSSEHIIRLCKFSDDTCAVVFIWRDIDRIVTSQKIRQYTITVEEYDRLVGSFGYPNDIHDFEDNLFLTYKRYTPVKAYSPFKYHCTWNQEYKDTKHIDGHQ